MYGLMTKHAAAASVVLGLLSLGGLVSDIPRSTIVAVVGQTAISEHEVEQNMAADLSRLENEIYQAKRRHLDQLIATTLLMHEAKRRGISLDVVLAEVEGSAPPVTDLEIDRFIEASRSRLPNDAGLRDNVRRLIATQRGELTRAAYVDRLRQVELVMDFLPRPPVRRITVTTQNAPVKGAATAPVTLIEFADFYCPYCRKSEQAVNTILAKYGDRIRLVFKDLPLDGLHAGARKLSEAARCAAEQGLFWEFHDAAFGSTPDSKGHISELAMAQRVDADVETFERCVASGRYRSLVQSDVDEAARLGISGTPTFFVNGRILVGVQSVEGFSEVIDEEL